jgi:hypothetical protein
MASAAFNALVAYKFVKLLSTPWKKTDAYKLGIIDEKGGLLKTKKDLKTSEEKKAYTIIHTLCWNIRRLIEKVPVVKARISRFAIALHLLKDKLKENVDDTQFLDRLLVEHTGLSPVVTEDPYLTEGYYSPNESLLDIYPFINTSDQVRLTSDVPLNTVLGTPVYEAEHLRTGEKVVISYEAVQKVSGPA